MRKSPTIPRLSENNLRVGNIYVSPVNLTANGRAHLGHAAGPFLRMDVLQRHLRRAGHQVRSGLTTDGFENHVLVRAARENISASDLAHSFYLRIVEDLGSIGIRYNHFDDPAHGHNLQRFSSVTNALISALTAAGAVEFRTVPLPVDEIRSSAMPVEERFCIGGWFGATCPVCAASAGSFFCEQCGHHFEPNEALDPASRRGRIVEWINDVSAFLSVKGKHSLAETWAATAIEPSFRDIAMRYVNRKGEQMRLTVPGVHGLPWESANFTVRQILFSYSSLLYAHSLYCGDREAESSGAPNPFSQDSDTFLISATGIDNTIPMLVGVTGCALSQSEFRPFDRIFFNHFLRLNGSKFSTSRNHVIWAGDIARSPNISNDVLRLYLTEICPEECETDLITEQLVERHNVYFQRISAPIEICTRCLSQIDVFAECSPDGDMLSILDRLYESQRAALSLDCLRVSRASAPVFEWIDHLGAAPSPQASYTWLMGFSILAWPLMPKISEDIWHWLGHSGHPQTAGALMPSSQRVGSAPKLEGSRLVLADIDNCVPRMIAA